MAANKTKAPENTAPEAVAATAPEETAPKLTDAQIDAETKVTGDKLRAGKKVRIRIPEDKLNPKEDTVPVCVNGHLYRIKRGESVEVPEVVAEILHGAGYI